MNQVKKPPIEKLDTIQKASNQVLFHCRSVFPFNFFPDEVVVDKNKVDLVYGYFFFSKEVISIMLEDIRTVEVTSGPFFASLKIDIVGFEINPEPVRYLSKSCALEVRKIVVGLTKAKREEIELTEIKNPKVRSRTKNIGETNLVDVKGV